MTVLGEEKVFFMIFVVLMLRRCNIRNFFESDVDGVASVNMHNYTDGNANVGLAYMGHTGGLAHIIAHTQFSGFRLEPTNVSENQMDLAVVLDKGRP